MHKVITFVSEGTVIEGNIYSPYPTQISGYVNGDIISKGSVTIDKYGEVKGNIKTEDITISGKLNGNLIVSGKIKITSTGKLLGIIISKDLDFIIEQGGTFKGNRFSVENEDVFKIKQNEILDNLEIKIKKAS